MMPMRYGVSWLSENTMNTDNNINPKDEEFDDNGLNKDGYSKEMVQRVQDMIDNTTFSGPLSDEEQFGLLGI